VKSILISLLIAFVLVIIGAIMVYEKKKRTGFAAKLELGLGLAAFLVGLFISASSLGLLILNRMEQKNGEQKVKAQPLDVPVQRKSALQKRIEYLQKFVPAGALANSDPRFMTFAGIKSAPRMPMVFPYELRIDPVKGESLVGMHTGEAPVDDPKSIEVIIKEVIALNLDNQFMVAKVKATGEDKEEKYILFSFKSGTVDHYETEEKLWKAADDAGYNGPETLLAPMKLREDYFQGTPDF